MPTPTPVSLHVLRLAEPVTARGVMRPSGPASALRWVAGAAVAFAEDGTFAPDPTVVHVLGTWSADDAGRAARDAVVAALAADPVGDGADVLGRPWPRAVLEGWHVALDPYRHHGELRWGDGPDLVVDPGVRPADGPVVTMTSTGFHDDVDRVVALGRALHEVQRTLPDGSPERAPGPVRAALSIGRRDHDGRTVAVWRDEAALTTWAYRDQPHAGMPARDRAEGLMPRSSFTRFAVVAHGGTWDGVDPVAACGT